MAGLSPPRGLRVSHHSSEERPAAVAGDGCSLEVEAAILADCCHQMYPDYFVDSSVFLNQLFQAMRASVPAGGIGEPSPGEKMFTAMLDEQLAKEAAFNWERGLGEQIYRQLSRRMTDQATGDS